MNVTYTSSVTGEKATVQVDQSIWSILKKTLEITCGVKWTPNFGQVPKL